MPIVKNLKGCVQLTGMGRIMRTVGRNVLRAREAYILPEG